MEIIDELKMVLSQYYFDFILLIPKLFTAFVVSLIFLVIVRITQKKITNYLTSKMEDNLLTNFINSFFPALSFLLSFLLFLYIMGFGGLTKSIMGTAGVSAIVIGFAFKDLGENFLAGVILAFNRPFRLGDTIKTNDVEGNIVEMSLRDTHIKTFDGKDVYVPNGQILKNPLYNYTIDGFLRKEFVIGVDYGTDVDKARTIILDILKNADGVIQDDKAPITLVNVLSSSTLNIKALYWIDTFNSSLSYADVHTNLIKNSLINLAKAEISMPGDIIELKNYNNIPLNMKG
jgi:small-conductance mechanosensitive channel